MAHAAYKLVDKDGYTRRGLEGETMWLPIGTTVRPSGEGTKPCEPGVLHGYVSPEVAILWNPEHAKIKNPRLLRIMSSKPWESDGLKRWTTGACQVLAEVDLPVLTTEEVVAWAIVLAPHASTREWATLWLTGDDRSTEAAAEAANAAAMAWAADAAWVAARAAEATAKEAVEAEWDAEAARAAAVKWARIACAWSSEETAENDQRLVPALERARSILAGEFPAEQYDGPFEKE